MVESLKIDTVSVANKRLATGSRSRGSIRVTICGHGSERWL